MPMTEILEALMLTAFSVSWYCSIWKMLSTGQASGKSLGFVVLICLGYLCGIGSKIVGWSDTGMLSSLIFLYVWNLGVTAFDAWLVYTLSRHPRPPVLRFSHLFRARAVPETLHARFEGGPALQGKHGAVGQK